MTSICLLSWFFLRIIYERWDVSSEVLLTAHLISNDEWVDLWKNWWLALVLVHLRKNWWVYWMRLFYALLMSLKVRINFSNERFRNEGVDRMPFRFIVRLHWFIQGRNFLNLVCMMRNSWRFLIFCIYFCWFRY